MEKSVNTYIGGLDRDTSKSKYQPNKYFNMLNGKVITEDGLSTGSITNEKGNSLSFTIPDTQAMWELTIPEGYTGPTNISFVTPGGSFVVPTSATTLQGIYNDLINNILIAAGITLGNINIVLGNSSIFFIGLNTSGLNMTVTGTAEIVEIVPAQTGLKIVGMGTLRNKVIIFTTPSSSVTPSSYCQIWVVEYDETTQTIEDINGTTLVPSEHLVYNQKLDLSLEYRVGEIIGRYETTNIQRIYWTDNYNPVRVFNIALGSDAFALNPEDLNLQPGVLLTVPTISSIGVGSIPTPSCVQYCYRLKNADGAETTISPASPPLPLTNFDSTTTDYEDYEGTVSSASRSVTYTIDNIDTDYSIIEHIVVLYRNKDVPEIYMFKQDAVPSSGTITVTHSGTEDYLALSLVEFNALTSGFSKCKSLSQKRNRLVAANISTEKIDLDYDARAYRFNTSQIARLYDGQGTLEYVINGGAPNYLQVIETADAVNPFNDENPVTNSDWAAADQYKYQADGFTLGGTGPNISYEFITEELIADTIAVATNFPYQESNVSTLNISNLVEETLSYSSQYGDFKSPYRAAYLRGFARGETYRFGIVFYDKAGNPTYTKWIGDIRFPECQDTGFDLGTAQNGWFDPMNMALKSVGIRFTVDISSIKSQISGFSIVRLERAIEDRTVLGSGSVVHFESTDHPFFAYNKIKDNNGVTYGTRHTINGVDRTDTVFLLDRPGLPTQSAVGIRNLFGYISPETQWSSSPHSFISGDYLRTIGYYEAEGVIYNDSGGTNDGSAGIYYKAHTRQTGLGAAETEKYLIESRQTMTKETTVPITGHLVLNASYAKTNILNRGIPLALGNKKELCIIDSTPGNAYYSSTPSYPGSPVLTFSTSNPGQGDNTGVVGGTCPHIKLLSYRRFLANQYNGNTYTSRTGQSYISCSNFVRVTSNSDNTQTPSVFGGDVYVYQYSDEVLFQYWNDTDTYDDPYGDKLSVGFIFPCESTINFGYHSSPFIWVYEKDSTNMGNNEATEYSYYPVYSQEANQITKFVTKPLVVTDTEEHPHRIWASDTKTDGEFIDSWRIFRTNNYTEVDGIHGQINKVVTNRDRLFFYQDKAIGIASIEDRNISVDPTTGTETILGTGRVLDYYSYLTTETGTQHQFSVVSSGSSLYHVDARLRKIFRVSDGIQPISDIKGLSAYLDDNLTGYLQSLDKTTRPLPIGIHGEYDPRNNRVLFTVLNAIQGEVDPDGPDSAVTLDPVGFTIGFSEAMQSFESFYSFTPRIYLNTGRRLLSVDPEAEHNDVYIHNISTPGVYYGDIYPFNLTVLVNKDPYLTKVFDSIDYMMESKNSLAIDQPIDTFNSLRFYTAYQDSGVITLTPATNIIRKLRHWRYNTIRNNTLDRDRIRDFHMLVDFVYNNTDGNSIVLHDLITSYRQSPH